MTEEAGAEEETAPAYSQAFDKLVQSPDDVVGLLAYATYKQSIRESAQAGQATATEARNLAPAMVNALRSAAEQVLTEIVNDGIAQATPDIQSTAMLARLDSHHSDIVAALQSEREHVEDHITTRTGFLPAFGTNLLAWFVTLLLAVAILYLANRPSVEGTLSGALENHQVHHPALERSGALAPKQSVSPTPKQE